MVVRLALRDKESWNFSLVFSSLMKRWGNNAGDSSTEATSSTEVDAVPAR